MAPTQLPVNHHSTDWRIRPATVADAHQIAHIHVTTWRAAYAAHMPATYLNDMRVESRAAMWHKALAEPSPGITLLVLNATGETVGFCVYGPSRDEDAQNLNTGELVALNVLPSAWGKGYGSALCSTVLTQAQHWDAVTLWVLHGNERARRFYEKFGFTADGASKTDSKLVGSVLHEVRYSLSIKTQ